MKIVNFWLFILIILQVASCTRATQPIYKVTFDLNEGTGVAPMPKEGISGKRITLPENETMSLDEHSFGGWNTEPSGRGKNYFSHTTYIITQNTTLYAKWEPNIYLVYLNGNGHTGGYISSYLPGEYNSTIIIPQPGTLEKTGHLFTGWNTNADGTGESLLAGEEYTVLNSITLYAQWSPIIYTLLFYGNGHTEGDAPEPMQIAYYTQILIPEQGTLSKNGFIFSGWDTKPDGTGYRYKSGTSYRVTSDASFYAQWSNYIFDVQNEQEWFDVLSIIRMSEGNSNFYINITASFTLQGSEGPSFGYSSDQMEINISGDYSLTLSSPGNILNIRPNQTVFLFDTDFVGYTNNGTSIVICSGEVNLAGSASLVGNYANNAQGSGIILTSGGKLVMADQSRIESNSSRMTGGGVYMDSNCEFTMLGGTIRNNAAGILASTSSTITLSPNAVIENNSSYGISLVNNCILTMNGGVIRNHRSNPGAGGVSVQNSVFYLYSGIIQDNSGYLGGVYIANNSSFYMYETAIIENNDKQETANNGAGVTISQNSVFQMYGGLIRQNAASFNGGGVYVMYGSNFIMSGGTITGNTALVGGGVYLEDNSVFDLVGGIIFQNSGSAGSGGIGADYICQININNNSLIDNNVGGGISLNFRSTLTMTGGIIKNNQGPILGGVYVNDNSTFNFIGGIISENTSPLGGGIIIKENSTLNMDNPALIENNTSTNGGGVYVTNGSYFNMQGGSIQGNHASGNGGGVLMQVGNNRLLMSGGIIYGNGAGTNSNIANLAGASLALINGVATYGDNTPITSETPAYINDNLVGSR